MLNVPIPIRCVAGFCVAIYCGAASVAETAPGPAAPFGSQAHEALLRSTWPKVARGENVFVLGRSPAVDSAGGFNLYRLPPDAVDVQSLLTEAQARELVGGLLVEGSLAGDPVRDRYVLVSPPEKPDSSDQTTRLTLVDLESSSVHVLVDNGQRNTLPVFSPDGSKIAYYAVSGKASWEQHTSEGQIQGYSLRVLDMTTGIERVLSQPALDADPACAPAWSPDGAELAFAAQYGRGSRPIHLVRADGASSRTLGGATEPHNYVDSVIWPTREFLLATFTGADRIGKVHTNDGSVQVLVASGFEGCLSLSPDRRHFAASTLLDSQNQTVRVLNLDGQVVEPGPGCPPISPVVGRQWALPPGGQK